MNLKKLISSGLVMGLLLNSSLSTFASTISKDERYETFEGNNIIINDILEEDKVDLEIKGNTFVNAIGNPYHVLNNGTIIGNSFSFISNGTDVKLYFKNSTIKENTTYTVFYNITKNTLVRLDDNNIDRVMKLNLNSPHNPNGHIIIEKGQTGIFSKVITTNVRDCSPYLETLVNANYKDGGEFEIKDIIVIEGDYSHLNLNYFEGLQSSFEDNLVTQEMIDNGQEKAENLGKHKVEYKVMGKNIFDGNAINAKYNLDTGLREDAQGVTANMNPIKVLPNTEYSISNIDIPTDKWSRIFFYDINMNFISNELIKSKGSFVTPKNANYINFHIDTVNFLKDIKVQIEEGSITEYEPYKEQINAFYLNSPLLEGDAIEYINGQTYHVKRRKKIVLDGKDEDWLLEAKEFNLRISDKKHSSYVYSDKFRFAQTNYKLYPENNNCILMGSDDYYGVLIRKDEMSTVDEFKQWLSENPVTLVYELAEPIYESIEANVSIQLFEGTTHISNNSNIPTIMEITVDRVANRAKEYSELAKSNPTIENISLARMWTNLMRESILKDEFQDSIDGIIEIADITLERKTVSSNIDIYIKSENTLLMGLNTNSITFEDFSGVEDLEKTNAVNISINSSLPYQLNAYLPTEIQNADKTNIMDKSILNIKESGESTYQAFANTSDKIMLKDNCPAGNYLAHGINIKLKGGIAHEKDVYKTVIKFEAEQK